MRTGLPNDFSKLNRDQPAPRCFGSLTIQPLRTGAGNPIEIASKVQPRTNDLSSVTRSRGVMSGPDLNFRRCEREIITFTFDPPTSMTRIFFFTAFPISSVQTRRFPLQPQSVPADPHAVFWPNPQAFSSVRVILPGIATVPAGAVLRLRALSVDSCRPAAIHAPSHDRSEMQGCH